MNGGHEVMITETWLGETNWDFVFNQSQGLVPRATALDIRSNDHYILNTIVFSSLVGLRMGGAANMISGLHVWFPVRSPWLLFCIVVHSISGYNSVRLQLTTNFTGHF